MLIKRQKKRVFSVLVDTFWYKVLFAGPRVSSVEQKDFSFDSLCRFLLRWLCLDWDLVMKNKRAQGMMVMYIPLGLASAVLKWVHFSKGPCVLTEMWVGRMI